MTREEIQTLTLRVTEANAFGLVVVLYDGALMDIAAAKKAFAVGDTAEFTDRLHHATRFINELINELNFSVALSRNLMSLYTYINRTIAMAVAGKHTDGLESCEEVINKLRSSFDKLANEDKSGPMMTNTQSLYAGLTYGKGYLNESYMDVRDYNRGFKA